MVSVPHSLPSQSPSSNASYTNHHCKTALVLPRDNHTCFPVFTIPFHFSPTRTEFIDCGIDIGRGERTFGLSVSARWCGVVVCEIGLEFGGREGGLCGLRSTSRARDPAENYIIVYIVAFGCMTMCTCFLIIASIHSSCRAWIHWSLSNVASFVGCAPWFGLHSSFIFARSQKELRSGTWRLLIGKRQDISSRFV